MTAKRKLGLPMGLVAGIGAVAAASVGTPEPARAGEQETVCKQHEYAMGIRYQQKSAEVDALQRQAFHLAKLKLDQKIAAHDGDAKLAIITDVDETLIDNTRLLVRDMRVCRDYTVWDTWSHWEKEGKPDLIPGAMDFLEHADEQGVAIYYVSNRFGKNKPHTIETLNELGMPQVSKETVKLYGKPKTERRAEVREDHKVVLLLGDSLADFHGAYDDAPLDEQRKSAEKHADKFGDKWIVLPNSTYGDWDEADLDTWDAPIEVE